METNRTLEIIRSEIERGIEESRTRQKNLEDVGQRDANIVEEHIRATLKAILSFLSTLEESEKPMNQEDLEEEINRLWESFADEMEGPHNLFDIYARLARHFAEWGAEHLADNRAVAFKLGDEIAINGYKLVYDKDENAIRVAKVEPSGSSETPVDLEEAAEHHTCKAVDAVKRRGWELETQDITDAFIAGAKWDRQQMLKEAVEGEFENEFIGIVNFNTDFTKYGYSEHDKVRVIVLPKED